ncbi:MAG TPA: hypothetical protein VK524_19095 [Polyangiaceae bacterium]|nr:hypothetical protein [Polyangiaceae bacterium]
MPQAFGQNPFTTFGLPPDGVAWVACCAALLLLALGSRTTLWLRQLDPRGARCLTLGLALLAALLSAGYIVHYLRGGPRIVDATSYFLEARALSRGELAFDVPWPSAAFRGRFLTSPPDSDRLAVIFPPGWPALLALGFKVGFPLAVGPALAFALVLATYALALRVFERRDVAILAALLSALCAALRYHTADTMSHALCALLLCILLYASLRGTRYWPLIAGVACGWLIATRPLSGAAGALIAGFVLAEQAAGRFRRGGLFLLGVVPGVALLALHQHAATGHWFSSAQYHYYALADGPPGCFRYGFGQGIGCRYEHADAVARVLPEGYGLGAALLTTSHRVLLNLIDIGNAEPIALLLPIAVVLGRRLRGVRVLAATLALFVLAYAPFYFPGNYPGGGARFLADVLPLEHVLVAWAAVRLGCERFLAPLALTGFGLHTSYAHRALAEREGGRPMYEPQVLEQSGVDRGLVFVTTDHGFNLAHVPGSRPELGVLVARAHRDANDAVLWNQLGRPPSYLYSYDPFQPGAAGSLHPYVPELGPALRFEGESAWPLRDVSGGWAHPAHAAVGCISGGRGLRLRSSSNAPISIVLDVAVLEAGPYLLSSVWSPENGTIRGIVLEVDGQRSVHTLPEQPAPCSRTEPVRVWLRAGPQRLRATLNGSGALLDYVQLTRAN